MSATIEHITEEALALSEEQRAQLAHRLLQSLEPVGDVRDVEVAWDAEIARRVQRVEEGTATGRPAEDVFRDIRAKYQ
jgi:putative addiction module component (TIGR02574 family)